MGCTDPGLESFRLTMNIVLESPIPAQLEPVECPSCKACFQIAAVDRLHTRESLEELYAGDLNTASCPSCRIRVRAEIPVHLNIPDLGIERLQYLPFHYLENPELLEAIHIDGVGGRLVFSLEEMAMQVQAQMLLAHHACERRVNHRKIEIPPVIEGRVRGTYDEAKLKTLWYISTCFVEGQRLTAKQVDRVIVQALSRLDDPGCYLDMAQLRACLCELKLLTRSERGRFYRKNEQQQ